MNSEQKNLDYWFSLNLWPLDAACRWVCDADPNNPDQAPIQMPDPATRPAWVNLHHQAIADDEITIIEGKGGARGVQPAAFIKWARSKGRRLDAKFDALLESCAAKGKAVKPGITKGAVINAFEGLYFDRDKWDKYLGDPPEWLACCRAAKGSKKASATWWPHQIAVALYDKKISIKKLDAVFVSLKDWDDEWQEASALFRD